MTHIAGLNVTIEGRYVRQRCAWCGEILIDEDLTRCMTISSDGDTSIGHWEIGAMVRVDGNASSLVTGPLPDDACSILEITRP